MPAATPAAAVARLRAAAQTGQLDGLAGAHGLRLLVAFGSAARDEPSPRDVDLAFAAERGATVDPVALLGALTDLTGTEALDLLDLDRAGTVARARALGRCVPLFESRHGEFAREQLRALMQFADTGWLRDAQLRSLAS